jgi:hypothetical protein
VFGHDERQEIRIRKVAVVLRLLLGPHRARLVALGIEETRFLQHRLALLEQLDLTARLELDRMLHEPE